MSSDQKPMTMEDMQKEKNLSLSKFQGEIMEICLNPEYSHDVILEGLDSCRSFIREEQYKARFNGRQ